MKLFFCSFNTEIFSLYVSSVNWFISFNSVICVSYSISFCFKLLLYCSFIFDISSSKIFFLYSLSSFWYREEKSSLCKDISLSSLWASNFLMLFNNFILLPFMNWLLLLLFIKLSLLLLSFKGEFSSLSSSLLSFSNFKSFSFSFLSLLSISFGSSFFIFSSFSSTLFISLSLILSSSFLSIFLFSSIGFTSGL